jgi:hypothetical protein
MAWNGFKNSTASLLETVLAEFVKGTAEFVKGADAARAAAAARQ